MLHLKSLYTFSKKIISLHYKTTFITIDDDTQSRGVLITMTRKYVYNFFIKTKNPKIQKKKTGRRVKTRRRIIRRRNKYPVHILVMYTLLSAKYAQNLQSVSVCQPVVNNIQIHARVRTYIHTKYPRTIMSCKLNRCYENS